jgi:LCP family protein required for cell wall assembly
MRPATRRIAPIAPLLSLLLPGLGQGALGRRRRGFLLVVPAVAVGIALLVLGVTVASDPTAALDLVPTPDVLPALLALEGVLLAYHLIAIADAQRLALAIRPVRGRQRLGTVVVLAVVLLAAVGVHGAIGWTEVQLAQSTGAILAPEDGADEGAIPDASFGPEPSDAGGPDASDGPSASPDDSITPDDSTSPSGSAAPGPSPSPSPSPTASGASASPSVSPDASASASASPTPLPSPTATPVPAWAADGRLNLLLVGSDAGPDRWSLRTDTMIVLSVDTKTARAALFGIPRNLINVPLPPESAAAEPNGKFPGLLNALYVYAMGHPKEFPGGDKRGWRAVSGSIQELLGVRLDGIVAVNLQGLVSLVDEFGGLWIDIPEPLVDDNYPLEDGSGWIHLSLKAGCQHLDGRTTLAYARSRHQDSDYGRMHRQQLVLLALRRQLDPVSLLPKVPHLLSIASDNLWTTLKRSDLRGLAQLAKRVDVRRVDRVVFAPSAYPEVLTDPEIAKIRRVTRTIFDGPLPPSDTSLAPGQCP